MYAREITIFNRGCLMFLIDQSALMNDPFAGNPAISKAVAAADTANQLIWEIIISCTLGLETGTRNYMDLGVIGYGAGACDFGWRGPLHGRGLTPVTEVRSNVLRIEERIRNISDGAGGRVESMSRLPVWLDPFAENGTPMAEALMATREALWPWVNSHWNSFPPVVIVITGGGQPDVVTFEAAKQLKSLGTSDGTLVLCVIYLSSKAEQPALFPSTSDELPDGIAQALFEMSSIIPDGLGDYITVDGNEIEIDARGFAVNSDVSALIWALPIGTRVPVRQRR